MAKKPNHLSFVTTPITLFEGEKPISWGTGFYYSRKISGQERVFLVTNYHVLTGNGIAERNKDPKGDRIVFCYHHDQSDPSKVVSIKAPLYSNGEKIWLEHQGNVDIALIPVLFDLPVAAPLHVINEDLEDLDAVVQPTDKVTLVGYPRMFFDKANALPIYKTGSIASEPNYDFNSQPYFIVDVAAFAGNSGSPVLAIFNGSHQTSRGDINLHGDLRLKFLGVYSAGIQSKLDIPIEVTAASVPLVAKHSEDLHLGIVWKSRLIEEIFRDWKAEEYIKKITGGKNVELQFKMSTGLVEDF